MSRTPVEIQSVTACACPGHARVVLHDRVRRRSFRVRVHAEAGQALLAEMNGLTGDRAPMIQLAADADEAAGGSIASLVLEPSADDVRAQLCVRDANAGERMIDAEPCEALLVAWRLKLPVWVELPQASAAVSAVPEVYRAAIESLDLEGLG
jgi:bifunctional DNase/RNase